MEIEFTFEEKTTREALNDTVKVVLKALDPDDNKNELRLAVSFADGHYPPRWMKRLGARAATPSDAQP